jgi:hypothetical protein
MPQEPAGSGQTGELSSIAYVQVGKVISYLDADGNLFTRLKTQPAAVA